MNKSIILAATVALLLFASMPCQSRAEIEGVKEQPNILFLFADDQRPDTISAWGNEMIETPHIDALAQRGINFTNNYCLGSNSGAVCMPSRAMLNCGRSYFRIDHQLTDQTLMPELLGKAGYQTFVTGKWHNGGKAVTRGFQHGEAVFMGGMCDHTKVKIHDIADGQLVNERVGEKFSSELFADATISFLRNRDKTKPFYAYTSFTAPHDPRQPPLEYREKYYAKDLPKPANFMPQHPFDNGTLVLRDEVLAAWPREWEVIQQQLAEYYGLVTHMDEQIGRILAELEAQGLLENTIIVYSADHGLAMGSHGLLGKQNVYEHSMGCPLIIAGPGVEAKTTDAFTYLLDIMPTVLEVAGIEAPENLDGESLWPIINGEKEGVRDTVFLSYRNFMRAIRKGNMKMIFYNHCNHAQLFDLEKDPHELNNLLETLEGRPSHEVEEYAKTIGMLVDEMRAAQEAFGDNLPLKNDDPAPREIDLSGHKRKADHWQPDWIVEKYFDAEPVGAKK